MGKYTNKSWFIFLCIKKIWNQTGIYRLWIAQEEVLARRQVLLTLLPALPLLCVLSTWLCWTDVLVGLNGKLTRCLINWSVRNLVMWVIFHLFLSSAFQIILHIKICSSYASIAKLYLNRESTLALEFNQLYC